MTDAVEIRRIAEDEGDTVAALWDRMCREVEDGGPLTPEGLRRTSRMLGMCAWHRDAFCLVAVRDTTVVGFVNGRVSVAEGLLPGLEGEVDALYVLPRERRRGLSRALAEAALAHLREQGADPVRYHSCADATEDHRFWEGLGFEADMVCLSLYRHR